MASFQFQQGLEWYYGKGYDDQLNYVLLAEFLKEEPYSTSPQDIGLRPWLVRPVGFRISEEQLGKSSGPGVEVIGLKKERIGQSVITAEISVWSGTNGKGSYAATVIFFLTLLAICLYVSLRYWLGPPAGLRFLALRTMSANLKMRLAPGPKAATLPVDYFLADDQGRVSQGEIWGETIDVRRIDFPSGPSYMQLSVKAKEGDPNTASSLPILAELDELEISDVDLNPGK